MKKTIKILLVSAATYAGFAFAGNDSHFTQNTNQVLDTIAPTDTTSVPDMPGDTTMPESPMPQSPMPDTTQLYR